MYFVPFWVIPRRLSSNCRRFGTHYRFHLHRQVNEVCQWMDCVGYLYLVGLERRSGRANRKWCARTGTPLPIGSANVGTYIPNFTASHFRSPFFECIIAVRCFEFNKADACAQFTCSVPLCLLRMTFAMQSASHLVTYLGMVRHCSWTQYSPLQVTVHFR